MLSVDEEKALQVDGEKGTAPQSTGKKQSPTRTKSKLAFLITGCILLIAIVVGVTVPLVRGDDDDSDDVGSTDERYDNFSTSPPVDTETETPTDTESSADRGPPTASPTSEVTPSPTEEVLTGPNITAFSVFNVHLANFSEKILFGYESDDALAKDLGNAFRVLLDRVVARNLGTPGYEHVAMGGPTFAVAEGAEIDGAAPPAAPSAAAPERGSVGNAVDDFGTNNQEKDVEEGDTVVANEDFIFAAYGDHIVVFNTTSGDQVTTYALPTVQGQTGVNEKPNGPGIMETPAEEPRENPDGRQGDTAAEEPPTRRRDSLWYWPRMASVRSMLLLDTKLVVVARGYGAQYQYSSEHVIDSYLGTRVFVYDITGLGGTTFGEAGNLKPITMKDISGDFVSMRAIKGNVHMVTSASILYYDRLIMPFEKHNSKELSSMPDDEYIKTVVERANGKYIPEFVRLFLDDVRVGEDVPSFAQINSWDDGDGASLAPLLYPDGYVKSVALVYSFGIDAVDSLAVGEELTGISSAGAILPAHGPTVYAAKDTMIIGTNGMGFSEKRKGMVQKTYLMSFKLQGPTSVPYTVGAVFGEILNQYSMDVVDGVLRMATTIRSAWFWGIRPMPEPVFDDGPAAAAPSTGTGDGFVAAEDEPSIETRDGGGGTERDGDSEEEPDVWEESSTENYVMTISIEGKDVDKNATTPSVMQQLDSVRIGKPEETITAVRFYDKYAYAVTFERTDPFYKLDVSNSTDIRILAEVNITGFSRYLHATDANEEMILAIGQEADANGRVLGLQISLFDMRDEDSPRVVRHEIEVDPEVWSSSDALWDKNAVRYNKDTGLLIIPVNIHSYPKGEHFNGFKLFEVNEDYIREVEECSVRVGADYDSIRTQQYCAQLSPRAMIFQGSMITMKEHYVTRTDLDTCATEWNTTVTISKEETADRCFY